MKASKIDEYILKTTYRPGIIISKSSRVRWLEAWPFNSFASDMTVSKVYAFLRRDSAYESL